jgi:hypothetical protein
VLASAGVMNPQIRFGEDLMSRVSYAMMNPGGAAEMTRAVREAMNALIGNAGAEAGHRPRLVVEAVIVCNPVMHHLLLGIDPVELGQAPFALATADALTLWAREIDLDACTPRAHLHPALHRGPCRRRRRRRRAVRGADLSDELVLVVDVGTNAEILLGDTQGVLACSSPTGPAFEGAQISPASAPRPAPSSGSRSTPSPRSRASASSAATSGRTIRASPRPRRHRRHRHLRLGHHRGGGRDAHGGARRRLGPDRLGRADRHPALRARRPHPRLPPPRRTASGGPRILVTQGDVRAIQLAKSALYAGARLLMDERGVDTVDRVVLAGAFGAHISPQARHGARHDPRLPARPRSPPPATPPAPARASRCSTSGARREIERCAPDREGRDRDRAALPGAFRRRQRHPARDRPLPSAPSASRNPGASASRTASASANWTRSAT